MVATDPAEAQRLLHLPQIKEPVRAHMFEITGDLRPLSNTAEVHLFADHETTLAIVARPDQPVLLCTHSPSPDDALLDIEQGPNLYLIGDHNICGLEDAYLTGLHAANQLTSHSPAPYDPC